MRIGINPARDKISNYHPARVTAVLLVSIPELTGYYLHRLGVLRLCLRSIVKNTEPPYDLVVFDNGSCAEVVDYLRSMQNQGVIQHLFLSAKNIGKIGAFKVVFPAAPGELIAYSDDDVLFEAGWLQAHLEILDAFPRVGMVSGVAIRDQFRYGNSYLQGYLSSFRDVTVEYGRYIPDDWEIDFCASTGRHVEKYFKKTREYEDILLNCNGVRAYSTATHFQFVAPKVVLLEALDSEWGGQLMGQMKELDERVDSMGYARLSTFRRYVRHIGNVIAPGLEEEISALGLGDEVGIWSPQTPLLVRLVQQRIIRAVLRRLNSWSYFLLNYYHRD